MVESYVSTGAARVPHECSHGDRTWANGATLRHYKIQRESERAFHVATVEAVQGRDSHYQSFSFASGAALSRTNIYTAARRAGMRRRAQRPVHDRRHAARRPSDVHRAPRARCAAANSTRGSSTARRTACSTARCTSHPEAQKTDGKQTNDEPAALRARAGGHQAAARDLRRRREVHARRDRRPARRDGAVLSGEPRHRRRRSRRLLTYAFAADVIETIELAPVRDRLESLSLARFAGAGAGA